MSSQYFDAQQFMVAKNGRQLGPFEKTTLLENVKIGNFTFNDLVWHPRMRNWEPLRYHVSEEEIRRVGISLTEIKNPGSPSETAGTLEKLFDLHPTVSKLVIIVDIMIFILAVPTLGLIIFSVLFLAVITYLIQKNQYGDSTEDAIVKTAIIMLLTGIPVPICTALILYYKYFGKKKALKNA